MERSDARILTTHAGALPRPDDLLALNAERADAFRLKPDATASAAAVHRQRLRGAVQDVVNRQTQFGIDIVNDGEFGKTMRTRLDYGAWISYVIERFTGFEEAESESVGHRFSGATESDATIKPGSFKNRRDRQAFPEVYADIDREMFGGGPRPMGRPIVGKVTYRGHDALQADIDNLRAAVESGFSRMTDVFMTSPAPGTFGRDQNRCYTTQEEFLVAVADALKVEYRAITDAGFILQIDDPGMAENWDAMDPSVTIEEYRAYARLCIEALNHALSGIPQDRVRYHMCWGSWHGPHLTDIPLRDIVDLLLTIRVGAYSLEAGNVRHEHEWKVWRDVKLPEGRLLIPGVVSHATNVVEHPELVADRIVQYAQLIGRENVIAGTDCGLGGRIHASLAWAKLQSLVEGARLASQHLWPS
ncbi:MAG: cobalamin-independent methionine synthase II family protein [Vicinamibacterales bacterium]